MGRCACALHIFLVRREQLKVEGRCSWLHARARIVRGRLQQVGDAIVLVARRRRRVDVDGIAIGGEEQIA